MGSIFVLGGDGYLGWPLAMRLAREFSQTRVLIVDNYMRRRLVAQQNADSLIPIPSLPNRVRLFRESFSQNNLEYAERDICTDGIKDLLQEHQPVCIYHMAQQPSAPYAMANERQALLTLSNNELGNMKLLWAILEHCPKTHLIKLGSMGCYAKSNLETTEGYFTPEFRGVRSNRPVPYPRMADDFYHATKINDTNHLVVACNSWRLRATEVMQSTVFGIDTAETQHNPSLRTRFDYDPCFGTVLNRFVIQALANYPFSVYGSGLQRTGLMMLNDVVDSLVDLVDKVPDPGEHRVINHISGHPKTVLEIAELVGTAALKFGLSVTPIHSRNNCNERNNYPRIDSSVCADLNLETLIEKIEVTFRSLLDSRSQINPRLLSGVERLVQTP